ncbi:hypothetical protein P7K49_031330, partial [Saguinus oedipus]
LRRECPLLRVDLVPLRSPVLASVCGPRFTLVLNEKPAVFIRASVKGTRLAPSRTWLQRGARVLVFFGSGDAPDGRRVFTAQQRFPGSLPASRAEDHGRGEAAESPAASCLGGGGERLRGDPESAKCGEEEHLWGLSEHAPS